MLLARLCEVIFVVTSLRAASSLAAPQSARKEFKRAQRDVKLAGRRLPALHLAALTSGSESAVSRKTV